jgi:hypothetical protein
MSNETSVAVALIGIGLIASRGARRTGMTAAVVSPMLRALSLTAAGGGR